MINPTWYYNRRGVNKLKVSPYTASVISYTVTSHCSRRLDTRVVRVFNVTFVVVQRNMFTNARRANNAATSVVTRCTDITTVKWSELAAVQLWPQIYYPFVVGKALDVVFVLPIRHGVSLAERTTWR